MRENGTPENYVEYVIFSNINMRPDHIVARLVEDGLISKEEAMKRLSKIPKYIEEHDGEKVYFCYSLQSHFSQQSHFLEPYECSQELYDKYPGQIRTCSIDDADIFAFVCSKKQEEYWIYQDSRKLLDYAKSKYKILLPIILDYALGYEIISIADFNTNLSFKIFGIDDQEPVEPEVEEPETIKYGQDIEMQTFSTVPPHPAEYESCTGAEIISGDMDNRKISFGARVCSRLSVDKWIRSYAAENNYKDHIIFQVWADKTIFTVPESDEKKYHVIVIVKKDNVYIDNEKNIGDIKPDQRILISGTVSPYPIEGFKISFVYKKDPILELPAVFADMVEIGKSHGDDLMRF